METDKITNDKKDKLYKVKMTEEEVSVVWLISNRIEGVGVYKEFFDSIKKKFKPFVSKKIDKNNVEKYITGKVVFNGKRLS